MNRPSPTAPSVTSNARPDVPPAALPHRVDAVVIGAGIVGTACAWRLASEGRRVVVLDPGPPGHLATAAGMGHIVLIDDAPAQLALSRYGRDLWNSLGPGLPDEAAFRRPGTLWIAGNDAEWELAKRKQAHIASLRLGARLVEGGELARLEPRLRGGLLGALLVPDDGIVYAPAAAVWLLDQAVRAGGTFVRGASAALIDPDGVVLRDNRRIDAPIVVNAAGTAAPSLMKGLGPDLPIRPRKGHLILTKPSPGWCGREVIELGYLTSAHGQADESIAFNVQPRAEGRLLIGASRQYGSASDEIEPRIIEALMARAERFLPGIRGVEVERMWTGFRAATPDAHPMIGPHPARAGLFVAAGHEGLGITTALATGHMIADMAAGRACAVDARPFDPARGLRWA